MKSRPIALLDSFMRRSRLELLPVRVKNGVAHGARWTLYPWSAYWRGRHEPAMHEAILALGDIRGWHCWDLGAHFGIYAVGLARRVAPFGSVAAFEPNPVSFARLVRHKMLNRLDCLMLFEAAVSDRAGSVPLLTYGDLKSTTTHLAYEGEAAHPPAHPVAVRSVVLDDMVDRAELHPPDFVKVDIEGNAHHALAGARRTLAAYRPILIVGLHSDPEVEGVLSLGESLGYEAVPLACPDGTRIRPGQDVLLRPRR